MDRIWLGDSGCNDQQPDIWMKLVNMSLGFGVSRPGRTDSCKNCSAHCRVQESVLRIMRSDFGQPHVIQGSTWAQEL